MDAIRLLLKAAMPGKQTIVKDAPKPAPGRHKT
jgi:hypothetical protein